MQENGPLVLGGSGRVGRAMARVWPNDAPRALWQQRVGGDYSWDILNADAPPLPRAISGIIVLAGVTQGAALADNTALALAACDLAQRSGGLRILLASSQAVYGPALGPVSEDHPCAPENEYGRAKLAMEQAVAGYENVTCLRIGNVVGTDALLRRAAEAAVTLAQFDNGTAPRRAYLGAGDLAGVCLRLLAHGDALPQVLNVARPGMVAMDDLLRAADVPWAWNAAGPGALATLDLDVSALSAIAPLPAATPEALIAQARAAGWRSA